MDRTPVTGFNRVQAASYHKMPSIEISQKSGQITDLDGKSAGSMLTTPNPNIKEAFISFFACQKSN